MMICRRSIGVDGTLTSRLGEARSGAWWSWCNGSIRGCDPRGSGSNPDVRPLALDFDSIWRWVADAGEAGIGGRVVVRRPV
jgi:hypothetical protein